MTKTARTRYFKVNGLTVAVVRNCYDGLWYARYDDATAMIYAGPFKTKKEAVAKMEIEQD